MAQLLPEFKRFGVDGDWLISFIDTVLFLWFLTN